ncbi:hypothetical protein WDU94_013911 [Cyamophila willieti]
MSRRSTSTNLVSFSEYITSVLDSRGGQIDVIYTDFSKCFDKIHHNILISKLEAIGITGNLLKWIESFHKGRKQIVKIKENDPEPIEVKSGCIQGGHLSGILFLCFINDITSIIPSNAKAWLFADDLKIAMRVGGPDDASALQETLDSLHQWCCDNFMELNIKKCKVMTYHTINHPFITSYTINNIVLDRINEIKDLGVTFQHNLRFNAHFKNIRNKSLQILGLLYRHTADFQCPSTLKTLYYAYVRSRLEYCSTVWSPQYQIHIKSIESVQRKFLRILAYKCGTRIIDHKYDDIMKNQEIISLEKRREANDLIFLIKLIHNKIYSPELLSKINIKVKSITTRSSDTFRLKKHRTNIGEFSPLNRIQSLGNKATGGGYDVFQENIDIERIHIALG